MVQYFVGKEPPSNEFQGQPSDGTDDISTGMLISDFSWPFEGWQHIYSFMYTLSQEMLLLWPFPAFSNKNEKFCSYMCNLEYLSSSYFRIFFNYGEVIIQFQGNLGVFELLIFQIFFNHGEVIIQFQSNWGRWAAHIWKFSSTTVKESYKFKVIWGHLSCSYFNFFPTLMKLILFRSNLEQLSLSYFLQLWWNNHTISK